MMLKRHGMVAALAAASLSMIASSGVQAVEAAPQVEVTEAKRKTARRSAAAYGMHVPIRSRNTPTKPKKKRNMRHVSKRVRRKHRRAA